MVRDNTQPQQNSYLTLIFLTDYNITEVRQYVIETYITKRGLCDKLLGAQRARIIKRRARSHFGSSHFGSKWATEGVAQESGSRSGWLKGSNLASGSWKRSQPRLESLEALRNS